MKKQFTVILFLAVLILSAFTIVKTVPWNIDSDFQVKFISENPEGVFSSMTGDISFEETNLARSFFNMKVDVKSINTGQGMLNIQAASDQWFDAEVYPHILFKSRNFVKVGNEFEVTGMLTIKDVTKEITFPFKFENNVFTGVFEVDRLEYNVGTMEGTDKNASQFLTIELSIPVTK